MTINLRHIKVNAKNMRLFRAYFLTTISISILRNLFVCYLNVTHLGTKTHTHLKRKKNDATTICYRDNSLFKKYLVALFNIFINKENLYFNGETTQERFDID